MRRRIAVIATLIALAAFTAGCSGGALPPAGNVSHAEEEKVLDAGAVILDVRTAGVFQGGFIAGAKNIPVDELAASLGTLDKSKPVLVYCATGNRSVTAMQILQGAGFTKVYNLTAGIAEWAQAGLPVTTDTRTAAGGTPKPSASGLPVMYEFYTDW
jgi:rhodanese-related sulfurtransferase